MRNNRMKSSERMNFIFKLALDFHQYLHANKKKQKENLHFPRIPGNVIQKDSIVDSEIIHAQIHEKEISIESRKYGYEYGQYNIILIQENFSCHGNLLD